ncbi:MAG: hypothetical protein PGN34_17055 [Methylobacterium frigidaeris]
MGKASPNLDLEEVEHDDALDRWMITVGFSRPWSAPRTRASERLESMGATPSALKRSFKILTMQGDGQVISMKSRPRSEFE